MSQGIPQSFIDANSCGITPEFDEAGKSHMRDKAARVPIEHQAYGHMSDEWVANRVRMLRNRDVDHEAICCAARDRIMRLSLRVAELEADAVCRCGHKKSQHGLECGRHCDCVEYSPASGEVKP